MFLTIRELKKKYGERTILQVPTYSMDQGLYWLRAPNGTGKTTLSKIIAGIIPFEGDIAIDDNITLKKHRVKYRLRVSFAEAEPTYPGFLTAADLIGFYAQTKKAPRDQIPRLTADFGIKNFLHQPCGSYSSGMLKRLSLLLAFIGRPRMIILDEPYNSLDDEARSMLNTLIAMHRQKEEISFLLASHEPISVKTDKTLTIENQNLIEVGK